MEDNRVPHSPGPAGQSVAGLGGDTGAQSHASLENSQSTDLGRDNSLSVDLEQRELLSVCSRPLLWGLALNWDSKDLLRLRFRTPIMLPGGLPGLPKVQQRYTKTRPMDRKDRHPG